MVLIALGPTFFPGLAPMVETGRTVRAEAGLAMGEASMGLVLQATHAQAAHYESQVLDPYTPSLPGDFMLGCAGPTVAIRRPLGPLWLGARLDAGVAWFTSPMEPEFYEDEVVAGTWNGASPALDTSAFGPWGEAGAFLLLPLAPEPGAPALALGASFGLPLIGGLGPTVGGTVGLDAGF